MVKQKKYKQNLYLQAFCRIFIHFTYKKFIYKPPDRLMSDKKTAVQISHGSFKLIPIFTR